MTTENPLRLIRAPFNVTQERFAAYMGVPLRTYEDLEKGRSTIRVVHIRAAERAALQLATDMLVPAALPEHLRALVLELAEVIRTDGKSRGDALRPASTGH